jgi:hypothetical protein
VRVALGLAADLHPQGLVTLGHPAHAPKERPRKPLADIMLASPSPSSPACGGGKEGAAKGAR